ncbi:AAA family ATPase [Caldithrix abyssi]|uniref:ATPase associated with various cellular activities AAA_3 n=1 Tax=Caldithrix abyssi DSM 13497 TaxID=880073 RepID=H1XR52_CALAY|nr:MoxR family ATPase [Caldithrix abyssi]APF17054.1 MoxR-like ATPase [Caldithrix abyssi DSM 13497]EHO41203.1 ATPase associated with various cellular activities AAA_3 [Caldithrix abyssi DSM 13497]
MGKDIQKAEAIANAFQTIQKELGRIIVGQQDIIEQLLIALFARGHCLLIGVPGLAKTLLIKTLGEVLDLKFSRIQFTPDLMPSDITGTEILEEDKTTGQKAFRFIKGPVFANIVLADEINRTPPKTQSALLEAMQEYRVTAAGHTFELDLPFFVLATQNPIEQEGTYPLPEAQLDRFMFSLWLDYPTFEQEVEIVKRTTIEDVQSLTPVVRKQDILEFQKLVRKVPVADNVVEFTVKLVNLTRPGADSDEKINEWIRWGAGPRASQNLILGAKVRALLHNRFTPEIEDIRKLALPVLRHRLVTSYSAEAEGVGAREIIDYLLQKMEA